MARGWFRGLRQQGRGKQPEQDRRNRPERDARRILTQKKVPDVTTLAGALMSGHVNTSRRWCPVHQVK
jgi:hypothetical protein